MDLLNASLKEITQRFDSMPYTIPPLEWTTVSDEAGRFLSEKCKNLGIVPIRYNDNIDELKIKGMERALARYMRAVEHHERTNQRQEELKFPPLPASQIVREAKEQIPALKQAIATLRARVGDKAAEERVEKLAELTDQAISGRSELPGLNELPVEKLREEARKEKLDFKPSWTRKMFIEALTEKVRQSA
jgi:hypothetical protein